jgi:pimeloyl-ACP methyl ester carboxylesterase
MGGLIALATLGAMARRKPHDPDLQIIYPNRIATLAAPADYRLTGWPRPFLMRYVAPAAWARPFGPLLGFRLGALKAGHPLDVVGHIDVPLLLTHGTNDGIVPVESVFHLQRRAPDALVRIYEGVEHGIDAMRLQIPQVLLNDLRAHFSAM